MNNNDLLEIKEKLSLLQTQVQTIVDKVEGTVYSKSQTDEKLDDLIDVEEAAKITRYSISTVYSKSSKGEMPSKKKDGRLRFSKKQILEWIDSENRNTSIESPTSGMIEIRNRYKR